MEEKRLMFIAFKQDRNNKVDTCIHAESIPWYLAAYEEKTERTGIKYDQYVFLDGKLVYTNLGTKYNQIYSEQEDLELSNLKKSNFNRKEKLT